MRIIDAGIELLTPAFLGGADQRAEWRSPPIKALFRQWWRVREASRLLASNPQMDPGELVRGLKKQEGAVFGFAGESEKKKSLRSRINIQISGWSPGTLTTWSAKERIVQHPEVGPKSKVDAHLYLGYGPLTWSKEKKTTAFITPQKGGLGRTALQPGQRLHLRIRLPEELEAEILSVLKLISWFGTIGARSRNGWGSLHFTTPDTPPVSRGELESSVALLTLHDCLRHDWSCALGRDRLGPLAWKTKSPRSTWEEVVEDLAKVKIAYRTAIGLPPNADAANPVVADRHILAYPLTNHGVLEWSARDSKGFPLTDKKGRLRQEGRLASQLRFKVITETTEQGNKYRGLAFHLPHRFPDGMLVALGNIADRHRVRQREASVWTDVHKVLDDHMTRI